MDKYTVAEVSYKNGFEAGIKKLADKLYGMVAYDVLTMSPEQLDNIVKELTKQGGVQE